MRVFIGCLGGLLLIIVLAVVAVWAFRRPIVENVLERANVAIPGRIEIRDGRSSMWKS